MEALKKLAQTTSFKIGMALIVGIAIGAIFYPKKEVTEETKVRIEELKQKEAEYKAKYEAEYQEKLKAVETQNKKLTESLTNKLEKTVQENSKLRLQTEEQIVKIIRPDGTIEEKTIRKSDTQKETQIVTTIKEEFTRKIEEIETRYKEVYAERLEKIKQDVESKLKEKDHKIAELESKKHTKINDGDTRLGVGMTNERDYYGLIERDIFGPIFMHGLIEQDRQQNQLKGGIGIGLKF